MANPITDYETLLNAAIANRSSVNVQAVKDGFDPFVSALLAHLTAHFVKHLDAAEAEEILKPEAERNQAALDWSAQLRAAFTSAEGDGRTPTIALADLVNSDEAS